MAREQEVLSSEIVNQVNEKFIFTASSSLEMYKDDDRSALAIVASWCRLWRVSPTRTPLWHVTHLTRDNGVKVNG